MSTMKQQLRHHFPPSTLLCLFFVLLLALLCSASRQPGGRKHFPLPVQGKPLLSGGSSWGKKTDQLVAIGKISGNVRSNRGHQSTSPPPPPLLEHLNRPRPGPWQLQPQTPPKTPPKPPSPGPQQQQQQQKCGKMAVYIADCAQERPDGCFLTTCTQFLVERWSGPAFTQPGCYCLRGYFWEDDPGSPAPGTPGVPCISPSKCGVLVRYLESTSLLLMLVWPAGMARFRSYKMKQARTDEERKLNYVNEDLLDSDGDHWQIHNLMLADEGIFPEIRPTTNWWHFNENVYAHLLNRHGNLWTRAFLQEQSAEERNGVRMSILDHAWHKHGSRLGVNYPPKKYFSLAAGLRMRVNLDGRLAAANITPSDTTPYFKFHLVDAIMGGGEETIPRESFAIRFYSVDRKKVLIDVGFCFENVLSLAFAPCPDNYLQEKKFGYKDYDVFYYLAN